MAPVVNQCCCPTSGAAWGVALARVPAARFFWSKHNYNRTHRPTSLWATNDRTMA